MSSSSLLPYTVVIENLEDKKVIRKCPLVCKASMDVATGMVDVTLAEAKDERSDVIVGFMTEWDLIVREPGNLPAPPLLQNVKIVATQFRNEAFKRIITNPSVTITALDLLLIPSTSNVDQKVLEAFLVNKGMEIRDLRVGVRGGGFDVEESFLKNDQIRLPALKHLVFRDSCREFCRDVEFIQRLIFGSTLESLVLHIMADNSIMTRILKHPSLKTIKTLCIHTMKPLSVEEWTELRSLELPELEKLTFLSAEGDNGIEAENLSALIQNFSSTLEVLSANHVELTMLPPCPKLEKIATRSPPLISGTTLEKFPALKATERL
jgi:hypothetical protein